MKKVLLSGGSGFLGQHLLAALRDAGAEVSAPTRSQCDLLNPAACEAAVRGVDTVFHLAAHVGGIGFNRAHPADLLRSNLLMGLNLIEAARAVGTGPKVVMTGTTCSYPAGAPIPMREAQLWDGRPNAANGGYGIAKRTLLAVQQAYRQQYDLPMAYCILANLYGPGDNFEPESSHVIPAAIRRIRDAQVNGDRSVTFWGDGSATREFLYVTDAARALVRAGQVLEGPEPLNIGSSHEVSIRELVGTVASALDWDGDIAWDTTKPSGQARKCMASNAQDALGWKPRVEFNAGIRRTVTWHLGQRADT